MLKFTKLQLKLTKVVNYLDKKYLTLFGLILVTVTNINST